MINKDLEAKFAIYDYAEVFANIIINLLTISILLKSKLKLVFLFLIAFWRFVGSTPAARQNKERLPFYQFCLVNVLSKRVQLKFIINGSLG